MAQTDQLLSCECICQSCRLSNEHPYNHVQAFMQASAAAVQLGTKRRRRHNSSVACQPTTVIHFRNALAWRRVRSLCSTTSKFLQFTCRRRAQVTLPQLLTSPPGSLKMYGLTYGNEFH